MKKKLFTAAAVLALALRLSAGALAAPAPGVQRLIEDAASFDGATVTLEGEAIGSALRRADGVWVNVSDAGNSAIGVFMTDSDAAKITSFGRYGVRGDMVRVTGIFSRACAAHGGDMDIHAVSVEVSGRGGAYAPDVPERLPALAAASAAAAAALSAVAVFRVKRYNRDKTAGKK
jgi:hypothetical protein